MVPMSPEINNVERKMLWSLFAAFGSELCRRGDLVNMPEQISLTSLSQLPLSNQQPVSEVLQYLYVNMQAKTRSP